MSKHWPDMTNAERNEWLATEVMGWVENYLAKPDTNQEWMTQDGTPTGLLKRVEFYDQLLLFDPLHDHNHMSTVRRRMFRLGYTYNRECSSQWQWIEIRKGIQSDYICALSRKDELQTEAAAIYEAIRKEQLMTKWTQERLDTLAVFAGGKKVPNLIGGGESRFWKFLDSSVVEDVQWQPHKKPAHADLVLRALVSNDYWPVIERNEKGDGMRCELWRRTKPIDPHIDLVTQACGDWWPSAVCDAALEVIVKDG